MTTKGHILIIDDEEHLREITSFALETVGYTAEIAADGEEGLEQFGNGEGWDLVLLDQRMPGLEGLEVLRRMRQRDPGAVIVMMTAYGSLELSKEAMKAGATIFMRKPFTPEILRSTVQVALSLPRRAASEVSPATAESAIPQVFRFTVNGYQFWPADLPQDYTQPASFSSRAFEIQAPSHTRQICTVEFAPAVNEQVQSATGSSLPANDSFWDEIGEQCLADYLLIQAAMPPSILPVAALNKDQMQLARWISLPEYREARDIST